MDYCTRLFLPSGKIFLCISYAKGYNITLWYASKYLITYLRSDVIIIIKFSCINGCLWLKFK